MRHKNTLMLLVTVMTSFSSFAQIKELKAWLAQPLEQRAAISQTSFANKTLSKKEAKEAGALLYADAQKQFATKYYDQWEQRELKFQDHSMPFYYQVFGDKPEDGRALWISLHGGGGAPAEVNDQQYNNQKHLYDKTMKDLEGVYLAMRAPTNTWNMWHQDDIDDFINIIIQMAVVKEGVNPNKVYLFGYSAGGDGLYQLAPRLADRLAAASMMAGHPGDASPNNLYNLPFALHMGGKDGAYNRNGLAREWKKTLDSLATANPGHYLHQAVIHEECGHWMKLQDAMALPWMAQYKRNPYPEKIIWRQDNRYHEQFYWLWCHNFQPRAGKQIIAEYSKEDNAINISETYLDAIQVMLNDDIINLNKPVVFKKNGEVVKKMKLERTINTIYQSLSARIDPDYIYSAKVELKL